MGRIASRRRWLQFSLRGFIVILTIGCVLLGRKAERARTQQDAIKRIEAIGGFVHYAWQQEIRVMTINGRPTVPEETQPGPAWLRQLIGDDFFQDVEGIYFVDHTDTASEQRILGLIEVFKRMPGLRFIEFWEWPQQETQSELEEALPDCEIRTSYPRPIQRNQDGTRMWLL
jgi:hypothetical protein